MCINSFNDYLSILQCDNCIINEVAYIPFYLSRISYLRDGMRRLLYRSASNPIRPKTNPAETAVFVHAFTSRRPYRVK